AAPAGSGRAWGSRGRGGAWGGPCARPWGRTSEHRRGRGSGRGWRDRTSAGLSRITPDQVANSRADPGLATRGAAILLYGAGRTRVRATGPECSRSPGGPVLIPVRAGGRSGGLDPAEEAGTLAGSGPNAPHGGGTPECSCRDEAGAYGRAVDAAPPGTSLPSRFPGPRRSALLRKSVRHAPEP